MITIMIIVIEIIIVVEIIVVEIRKGREGQTAATGAIDLVARLAQLVAGLVDACCASNKYHVLDR